MKPEVKKKWINALRSGEYYQGREMLKDEEGAFCTLGVLVDIATKEGVCSWGEVVDVDNEIKYTDDTGDRFGLYKTLPKCVVTWANLDSDNPRLTVNDRLLDVAWVNDIKEYDFDEIATLIEEQL